MDRNSACSKVQSKSRVLIGCLMLIIVIGISSAIALGVFYCTSCKKDVITKCNNTIPAVLPTFNSSVIPVNSEVCLTPGCIHTASNVLQMIDPSVDPCDDFYQFACGNFIKETNIPDERSIISTATIISDLVVEQMKTLIEEPIEASDIRPVKLMKKLYKACVNKTLIEEIGLTHIKDLIQEFGGWPVLGRRTWDSNFDWKKLVYKFGKKGFDIDYLMTLFLDVDQKNSSVYIINIDQPFLKLPREILINGLKDEIVRAYYKYMVDIAVMFGANTMIARKELRDVLDFEIQLANISDPNEERLDPTALYNPMTIKELEEKYSSIPWLEYIGNLTAPQTVTSADVVVVNSLNYLAKFEVLIKNTSPRTQANYLMWRAVSSMISFLSDDVRKKQLEFSTVITGKTALSPRWKECIDTALSLDIAASALYVRKYFKEDARQNVHKLVKNIHAELKESLKKVDWMDEETRRNALEKADTIVEHIGYPIELLDDTKLDEYYKKLKVNDKSYMESILNLNRFNTELNMKKLRLPVNKTEWISHSSSTAVNAFYSPNENSIQFPAGVLQGAYFNNDRPNYMNYGGIGFIIGHEMTHAFDDEGRQYDKDGNVNDWWIDKTKEAFKERAQCVTEYYGNYKVPEIGSNINGVTTQGENIADIGGLKQAYLAYDRWAKSNGEEPRLPGLSYTGRQLFWVSAGNIWCSKIRPEILKQRVISDAHTPDKYRILGPLSHLKEFSKDFNCPVGSEMNPAKKCQLW